MAVVWIAVCVLLVAAELHHLAFFAMFGAAGAAAAAVIAVVTPSSIVLQLIVAIAVAAAGITLVRPYVSKAFAVRGPGTSIRGVHGGLIGARGMTIDEVKFDPNGHVRLVGESWLAITADGSSIPPSTPVIVTKVVGTTLTVRAAEELWELT